MQYYGVKIGLDINEGRESAFIKITFDDADKVTIYTAYEGSQGESASTKELALLRGFERINEILEKKCPDRKWNLVPCTNKSFDFDYLLEVEG